MLPRAKIIAQKTIESLLQAEIKTTEDLMVVARKIAKKYQGSLAKKSELLEELAKLKHPQTNLLKKILRKRAVRTMSGIAPVAVLTKPYACPGHCAYCPTESNVPQSYLSNEPAVMRAIRCGYQPTQQVAYRLRALEANGHQPTKIELIVIGGTWSFFPTKYKYWYIASCFAGANNYGQPDNKKNAKKSLGPNAKLADLKQWLAEEQARNETATYQIIGLTLETRPDYITPDELLEMRELGCTRVEIGVQTVDDKILELNQRDCSVAQITQATKALKNYGFKVTYHLMAGLPGSSPRHDLAMAAKVFTPQPDLAIFKTKLADRYAPTSLKKIIKAAVANNNFNPDQLKYYPTVVTTGSLLYRWWQEGKYRPYSDASLQKLIAQVKQLVPPFVRIIRIIRDIPGESIVAGNKITNLRQVLKQQGVVCQCIRCREARDKKFKLSDLYLIIRKYQASDGEEYFISFENKEQTTLYGFARLRLAPLADLPATLSGCALLRELHVYGELVPVGQNFNQVQHIGLGKRLMAMSEELTKLAGYDKMAVISGVGVRGYYRKLGYRLQDTYLTKKLS